jgi:2-polyprenyl-3-methyl-5-hydroxy-6-metoxy-1,4-benzoquinol methylase
MYVELLKILRCPRSGQRLLLDRPEYAGEQIRAGWLVSVDRQQRYRIREFIPRFVAESNYADSFGMQWNRFRQTQLDSYSGHPISANRFWRTTGWRAQDLAQAWVLDAGCGAGRFAEIALGAGARVVALDYSSAVDACYANLGSHPNLHVVQGDIYALPLQAGSFQFVYSLGVLQHTPNVAQAVAALPPMVGVAGRLCVDFYMRSWRSALLPKYWLRPITKRLPKDRLFAICEFLVPRLLKLSRLASRVPLLGSGLKRLVPVADYAGILPLSEQQHYEWSLLDTFDWFSPQFDNPQTPQTVRQWLEAAGLDQIEVLKTYHLTGRGIVADAPRH